MKREITFFENGIKELKEKGENKIKVPEENNVERKVTVFYNAKCVYFFSF